MLTFIFSVIGILPSIIDNFIQFVKERRPYRIIFLCLLILSLSYIVFYWISNINEVHKIKEQVGCILTDESFFTKLISETEIDKHLIYNCDFNRENISVALIEMMRDGELGVKEEKVKCKELQKEDNLRFYFLTRLYNDKKQTPHNTRW